ncbi:MAG: hypothetical protein ACREVN_13030 [Gammaproteobacteria bacterium]
MKTLIAVIAFAVIIGLTACATKATQAAKLGPTFTEAEMAMLSDEDKLAIYNAQVRPEDQLECTWEEVVGSHQLQKVCMTAAEREWNRNSAQDALRRFRSGNTCNEGVCDTDR